METEDGPRLKEEERRAAEEGDFKWLPRPLHFSLNNKSLIINTVPVS